MKRLIFDAVSRQCIGTEEGGSDVDYTGSGISVDLALLPATLDTSNLSALYLTADNEVLACGPAEVLTRVKAARKAAIKAEAANLIADTDWKLTRARERDTAGWGTLADVDAVLALRESIRQSSSAAEAMVDSLVDVQSIRTMTWSISVQVPVPRRLTQTAFLKRFTTTEASAVLTATDSNVALRLFWQKMLMADWINPDDPDTRAGINALEIGGLLAAGRGKEVLS